MLAFYGLQVVSAKHNTSAQIGEDASGAGVLDESDRDKPAPTKRARKEDQDDADTCTGGAVGTTGAKKVFPQAVTKTSHLVSTKATGIRDEDIDVLGISFLGASALRACISGVSDMMRTQHVNFLSALD